MRFKFNKLLGLFIIVCNIFILYYCIRVISFNSLNSTYSREQKIKVTNRSSLKPIHKLVTVVLRDFEQYENDITGTAHSILNVFPNIEFFILYNELPYPPLDLVTLNTTYSNIKYVNLNPTLNIPLIERQPIFQIKTKYVLMIPDSVRITSRHAVLSMLREINKTSGNIVVSPVSGHELLCVNVNVSTREWILRYNIIKNSICDEVVGMHVILLETDVLKKLADGFLRPFPKSLYIQTSLLQYKASILKKPLFHEGKPVLKSHHSQLKRRQLEQERKATLFKLLKIKQVITEKGVTEWYGCTKNTSRCFGTVLNSMPSYLFERKWTPPCCLSNLRKTARHVFNVLDESGVRYWLEAGSLLGAMRNGDILPWDYDVDIGLMRDDLDRCTWLKKSKHKSIVDTKGFLWEKATEGNFFHVHFSKFNKIHVNLFPFYPKNGTMVKDSWFTSHRNMEFPESFLHPMSSLEFVGRSVPCPNNIRDFLELKFGKGSIENPEYPDPSKLKFP